jgi:hypothetical protein
LFYTSSNVLTYRTDDLALCLVLLQQPVSILDLLPRQHLVHKQLEATVLELWQRMLYQLVSQLALVLLVPAPQTASHKGTPLADEGADIGTFWHLRATHETQVDNHAVLRNRFKILLEVRCADKVDNYVYALVVRCLHDLLHPVLARGVEGGICTELLDCELAFRVLTRGRENAGGRVGARELDAGDGDRRGGGVPEDGLAGSEVTDEVHRLGSCYPCLA